MKSKSSVGCTKCDGFSLPAHLAVHSKLPNLTTYDVAAVEALIERNISTGNKTVSYVVLPSSSRKLLGSGGDGKGTDDHSNHGHPVHQGPPPRPQGSKPNQQQSAEMRKEKMKLATFLVSSNMAASLGLQVWWRGAGTLQEWHKLV